MRRITLADRVRYAFDKTMSKGPVALIGWLGVIALIVTLVTTVFIRLVGIAPVQVSGGRIGFAQLSWLSLMHLLDTGTIGVQTGSWPFLAVMFLATLAGLLLVSTLVGIVTTGIQSKLEDLRYGRSIVAEEGHVVFLGWSSQVFPIISELLVANARQACSCIAILAEKDKVEMEEEIRAKVGTTGKTRVVCRTGDPIDTNDLEIINPHSARSVIILAPECANPDVHVIKTLLALTNNPHRRPEPYHVVAEIRDPANLEVAKMVGRDEAVFVQIANLIPSIMAQTCRQSGLSVVYTELLDFGGDEIHFQEEPGLVGKTFGETLSCYEDSAVIGLRYGDGRVQLSPPHNTRIQPGDKVIAISEDDDTVRLSGLTELGVEPDAIATPVTRPSGR